MQQGKALKTTALVTVTAAATTLLIQACGGGDAVAQAAPDPLQGVWESTVTVVDCTTGAPNAAVPQFRSAQVFHSGGTMADTSSHPAPSRGPAWGVWSRGSDLYNLKYRFNNYNASNVFTGTTVVAEAVRMAGNGNSFTSTRSSQVLDASGAQVLMICSTTTGARFA